MKNSLFAAALLLATPTLADKLTPERVYAEPNIDGPNARDVQLAPDGTLVTWLKGKPTNGALDLWAADTKGGAPFMLVDSAKLELGAENLSEAEKSRRERMRTGALHGVVEYHWDEEGKFLLVPLNGDLYLAERAGGAVRRLTNTPDDEVDAKVSPHGHYVSFVRGGNMFAINLATGREDALTTDGKDPVTWGTAEFAAQEELQRFTGNWWAPDERHIALTHTDESTVDIIPRLEVSATGLTSVNQRYPRAGRPNAVVQLFVEDIASHARVKMDLGTNPDIYLARAAWSKDSRTLYVQRLSRDQKRLDLLACDPATGACPMIRTQTSAHWVELSDDFKPLANGDFLWSSEESGNRHLYLYAHDGKLICQVTHGDWPVNALKGVDEARGNALFTASIDTPVEMRLYTVFYRKPAAPKALTSAGGWWDATVADKGGAFSGTYSDPHTPRQTALYDAAGKRVRWIEENRLDASHPYYAYLPNRRIPDFATLKAEDGTALHYSITTPVGFDPAKKYPAIIEVYGGPHVQTVKRDWGTTTDQLLAEAGYVVFRLDNRGSTNRSVAFKTAVDRRLGTIEVADQMQGAKFLRALPYVDASRVAVSGWSYGGFMTLAMLTEKGAGFASGASGAPPTDWSYYDTCYTERYMGTPAGNAKGYADSDILGRLDNLHGRLLLLKGLSDDNVILANTTRLTAALQGKGVAFDMMEYPGQRHGIAGNARRLQLWRTYLAFFARTLKPAG